MSENENENTEALVEMDMARRAAVDGLDPADVGAAYGYVLGKLTPHLSQTESGRALWWEAWHEVGVMVAARTERDPESP